MKQKKILMICYYYPPLEDVGHKRSLAFSKYLKKYGWEPYVISVRNPDKAYCRLGHKKPPTNINVYYTYSLLNPYKILGKVNGIIYRIAKYLLGFEIRRNYLYDIFCIPDIFFGWIPLTLTKAIKLVKTYDIDFIYCSCPPFSSAVIGALLKILTKKKLIIDFRDPMSSDVYVWNFPSPPPKFRKKIDRTIASWFFNLCDIFIITSKELKDIYTKKYPQLKNKTFVIYNGFDMLDLKFRNRKSLKFNKLTIIYAGNFYFNYGKPEVFFKSLLYLKSKRYISKDNFQFLYYGNDFQVKDIAKKFNIEDIVQWRGFKAHSEVVKTILKSHVQLLRVVRPMISTKLFEGIALNIPLLALIEEGEAAEIIKKYSPSSYIVKEEVKDVNKAIIDIIEKYKEGKTQNNYVNKFLAEFSREAQSLKLIKILNNILF